MAKFRINESGDLVVVLTPKESARASAARMGNVVAPKAQPNRYWRSKAERNAGQGFSCSCGRNDLAREVKPGISFHKAPNGTMHDLR